MIQKVQGEQPFQVLATNFSIGPSNEGYTLQISADGNNYTNLFSVDANTTRMVTAVANGSFYRMLGNNSEVAVNWRTQCNDGGSGGGSGSGGTDTGTVQTMINQSLAEYTDNLVDGNPIVGMAAQLYSPDGVEAEGAFTYRTTGGDKDVSTGNAELRKIEGNSIYPELQYNDSASLERGGEAVTGFTYDIEWGEMGNYENVQRYSIFTGTYGTTIQKVRISDVSATAQGRVGFEFLMETVINTVIEPRIVYENGVFSADNSYVSVTEDPNVFNISDQGVNYGIIYIEDGWIYAETNTYFLRLNRTDGSLTAEYQVFVSNNIPNDIPAGESTYIFSIDENNVLGSWTPSLPQALQNMQIDGSDYEPQDGDEITINRTPYKEGRAQFSTPRTFVALGLNSFCKDSATTISDFSEDNGVYTVTVYAVAGLEAGYVVYSQNSGITAAGIGSGKTDEMDSATTVYGEALSIVYPTTAKPYIIVTTTDIDGLCIHPRWSGYNDLVYEPYEESKVEGLFSVVSICPMWSVGNVRNIIDIEGGQLIKNIGSEEYSAARVNELLASGYTLGVDFDFDSELIYEVLDTPIVVPITFDGSYKANDFGVEYFLDADGIIPTPLYAETYYMQNLVDKLRRMEGLVHLDSLSGTGAENTLYECNDKLFMWSDEGGTVAEWTTVNTGTTTFDKNNGYGLAFSHIPNGTKLFEFSYQYDDNWRYIVMSGDTLVLTESDNTIVTSCTIGNKVNFPTRSYNFYYVSVVYRKNYIGFYFNGYLKFQNKWDGTVLGGHFVSVDMNNYPYPTENYDEGMPRWNSKGQIVGKARENSAFDVQVNYGSDGYSHKVTFYGKTNGIGLSRMYVPTAGGTSGQILTSSGVDNAPNWSNWIKSVQITSVAYDALVVKDPSTLYLIVD